MKPNTALRQAHLIWGWSQADLVHQPGADAHTVGRWARGIYRPTPCYRERLCLLFGLGAQALGLLKETPVPTPTPPATSVLTTPALPISDPARPRLLSQILGHAFLLDELSSRLRAGTTCVLSSLPGVSKMTFAHLLSLDPRCQTSFPDGFLWLNLGPSPDRQRLLVTTLQAPTDEMQKTRTLEETAQYARDLRLLIILDDAWSLEVVQTLRLVGSHATHLICSHMDT